MPSALTTTEPRAGFTAIVTLAISKIPPGFPAASFAKIFTTTGVALVVVAISILATGLSVGGIGANTVISNADNGQPEV